MNLVLGSPIGEVLLSGRPARLRGGHLIGEPWNSQKAGASAPALRLSYRKCCSSSSQVVAGGEQAKFRQT